MEFEEERSETLEEVPLFEEVQEPFIPLGVLSAGTGAVGALFAGKSLDLAPRLGLAGLVAAGIGLAFREFVTPMKTILLEDEVQVRFGNRTRFRIPLKNVVRAFSRTYEPLREYGGWGIRIGFSGKAFNMRGNEGVQLVLRSGTRVLIGSQRAEELAAAIQRLTGCESTPDK